MLHNIEGYSFGVPAGKEVIHYFSVDDLKIYASNINTSKKKLDLVTRFSKETFDRAKCEYQQVRIYQQYRRNKD